jgi:uncharacterized protein
MYNLGVVLAENGFNEKAKFWYEKAAKKGNVLAANNLGNLYEKDATSNPQRLGMSERPWPATPGPRITWGCDCRRRATFRKLATGIDARPNKGSQTELFNLAVLLEEAGDHVEAETWYRQAAQPGHLGAANNLGVRLEERGRPSGKHRTASRAASAGHLDAATNLLSYRRGGLRLRRTIRRA